MRRPTHRQDGGAAAVEFALLIPILIFILLAIVDYGIWFSDSIGIRHGASEAARAGAVGVFPDPPCVPTDDHATNTACVAEDRTGAVGGTVAVHLLLTGPGNGWTEGRTLIVCSAIREGGLSGFAPLPEGGNLRAVSKTRIEADGAGSPSVVTDDDPSGESWGWCV